MFVWIICVDVRSRYMYIVLGGYLRNLGAHIVQSTCTLSISVSYRVFGCVRNRKSRLVCVCLSNLVGLDVARFYDEQCPPFPPKNGNAFGANQVYPYI